MAFYDSQRCSNGILDITRFENSLQLICQVFV